MSDTDLQLLARYARDHAEDAFAELVRRHLGLVHSAALRQVRSPQLAEEVAQSAFTDLARNAHRLARGGDASSPGGLTAWLYTVTRRTAIDVVRREARRQLREQIATEMNAMNATAADWTHVEPLLDEAMHALDETDRAAVLLRYFENKSLREVGASLGTTDDAAQKRVSRAVDRLREFFAKRGVTVGAGGLAVVISANAVQAAPVGLAVTISTAAALAGTTLVTTSTATAAKAIAMTTLQKALVTATIVFLAGVGIYKARLAATLRSQSQVSNVPQIEIHPEEALSASMESVVPIATNPTVLPTRIDRPQPRSGSNLLEVADGMLPTHPAPTNAIDTKRNPQPTNSIALVRISRGSFVMGSPADEIGRIFENEGPQTRVTISYDYWLGQYEVTVAQYRAMDGKGLQFIGEDEKGMPVFGPHFSGDNDAPVTGISWENATDFCRRLTERERTVRQIPSGYEYRLPTEAEWEYACRAGTTTRFSYGDDPDYSLLQEYAWFRNNSGGSNQPVGMKLPNPWGLYDMHGNASEWVFDVLKLTGAETTDPVGNTTGLRTLRAAEITDPAVKTTSLRASRDGSWYERPDFLRSARKWRGTDSERIVGQGFRVALAPRLSTQ